MPHKSPSPQAEQATGERYMTPAWMVRLWANHHRPSLPNRVLDAGCADGRLGRAFWSAYNSDIDLSILGHDSGIDMAGDFFDLTRADFGGDISIVTNPPFTRLIDWIRHCLVLAGHTGDVAVLLRTGVIHQVGFPFHPIRAYLPKRRVQFEVTPDDAYAINAARELDGRAPLATQHNGIWRLGSPGDDHGIFVFRNTPDPLMPLQPGVCLTRYIDTAPYLPK